MLNKFKKIACVLCSVLLILFATVPASAVTVPDCDYVPENNYDYYLRFDDGFVFCSTHPLIVSFISQHNKYFLRCMAGTYSWYNSKSSHDGSTGSNLKSITSKDEILDSNYDVICSDDNSTFFHQPTLLRRLLSQVAPTLEPTTTQTVLTLVLCGVGLMALLVGLHLLPKLLAKFLH